MSRFAIVNTFVLASLGLIVLGILAFQENNLIHKFIDPTFVLMDTTNKRAGF